MIQDPETGQQRRMLERPEISLLMRNATWVSGSVSVHNAAAGQT